MAAPLLERLGRRSGEGGELVGRPVGLEAVLPLLAPDAPAGG